MTDNLSAHNCGQVREIVECHGCELLHLPPCSPDLLNLIEGPSPSSTERLRAASAGSREELVEAMEATLDALTASDAHGFFGNRGCHRTLAQPL